MQNKQRQRIETIASATGTTWRIIRQHKHFVIDFNRDGRTARISMSATPYSPDQATFNAIRDVRRAFGGAS